MINIKEEIKKLEWTIYEYQEDTALHTCHVEELVKKVAEHAFKYGRRCNTTKVSEYLKKIGIE